MGKEINTSQFSVTDFAGFEEALRDETGVLKSWFNEGRFARSPLVGGYELEAWLVDGRCDPAPVNDEFLGLLRKESVVPELSRFNVELNAPPEFLTGNGLANIQAHLTKTWGSAGAVADRMGIRLAMIGILPTVSQRHLTLANMSDQERFRALNEQVLRIRDNRPLQLDIAGSDSIRMEQSDVMLEAAATSFQIHLQVNDDEACRYYNAAQVLSAPIVAACSNSPFLFGKSLWAETRIPLFEQAVNVQGGTGDRHSVPPRVTFGDGYVRNSLLELFIDNLDRHPV
ncbi:MAG: glutamate-cysteine ligase family protein, partial [Gammaproteobacteria bacterium]|nr:glutamate-cysteine ligase family protein [Gammaproteobacteria bacterium]